MNPLFRIGTRKSALARTQSEQVRQALEADGLPCELVEIVSHGDIDRSTPLYEMQAAEPGLFTKQLETALLKGEIDLAVHSLKDLPTRQPEGLKVVAVPKRVIAEDCLLVRQTSAGAVSEELLGLRRGARVGTSSLRREAQLLSQRPDLEIVPLRGNVPTRVDAVRGGKLDGVVLAEAGLFRLGLDLHDLKKIPLPRDKFVGAPGQGALALEVRTSISADHSARLARLHDEVSATETRIERAILQALEGGCSLPLGVRCEAGAGLLRLWAFLGIAGDRAEGGRKWVGFHHFDISEHREDTLVAQTIKCFKDLAAKGSPCQEIP